jgi:penicillin-binding protein 2
MSDKSQYNSRKWWILSIFAATSVIYMVRLYSLQVLEDKWNDRAKANAFRNIVEIPPRGMVFSRTGEKLVDNEISYNLMVVPRNIDFQTLNVEELCSILEIDTVEFNQRMQQAKRYSGFIP